MFYIKVSLFGLRCVSIYMMYVMKRYISQSYIMGIYSVHMLIKKLYGHCGPYMAQGKRKCQHVCEMSDTYSS